MSGCNVKFWYDCTCPDCKTEHILGGRVGDEYVCWSCCLDRLSETAAHLENVTSDCRDQVTHSKEICESRIRERDEALTKLAAAEAATSAAYREIDELRSAVKKVGIVLQRVGTDLLALNMPADECRRLLRDVLRGRRRFMRDSLGKELYEAVEKAGDVE